MRLLGCGGLFLFLPVVLLLSACTGKQTGEIKRAELCDIVQSLAADAESMRVKAIQSYEAAAENFVLARRWKAGELGSTDSTGKYASAQRRGWQRAYEGAAWCQAAEKLHDQVHSVAGMTRSDKVRLLSGKRVNEDCSKNMFNGLIADRKATSDKFLGDARKQNASKKVLERGLVKACRSAVD